MAIEKILVPDIGNFDSVDVIEIIAKDRRCHQKR
jgi:pyruvate dehydrogenase E2 component (dihydrolipoamide acetyltransferase)